MNAKAFVMSAAVVLGTSSVALPLVNLVVDPFQVFGSPSIPNINRERLVAATRIRLSKPLTVCHMRPDLVITGTSRAEFIFDPRDPALEAVSSRPYNLAMAGTGVHETRRLLEHAHNGAGTMAAIVTLDFHSFNAYREAVIYKSIVIDYDESNLVLQGADSCARIFWRKAGALLFSGSALRESFRTVRRQGDPENVIFWPDGLRDSRRMELSLRMEASQHAAFHGQTKAYLDHVWFPRPDGRFCFEAEAGSVIAEFRELVAFGRSKGMKLIFVLTPEHAMMQLAIRQAGLWPHYERWRSELVEVLAADAAQNPRTEPFPLWDFSAVNPVTAEQLPPLGVPAKQQHMRWWYEATHSQPEVGAQILRRIFQDTASPVPLVEGFGIRLDRANIGEHLARLRSGIADYAIAHPDEVAEVADLWRSLGPRQPPSEYCGDPLLAGASPPKPLAGLAPADTAAAARHQKRAEELKRRGKREAALEAYDSAIRVSPPNTALYFLRGSLRLELQDPVGALRDFDVGLRLDPANATLMALRDRAQAEAQQRAPVPQAAAEGTAKLAGDRTGATEDFLAGLKLETGDTTLQQLLPQVQPR